MKDLDNRFGAVSVLGVELSAGKLAKTLILPIIWTVCRNSIHFFRPIIMQSELVFFSEMRYYATVSKAWPA
jgi:hypothetical protein